MDFFNSHDSRYKSINHAIKCGETITLRLCMPRHYVCEGAELVIHIDHTEPIRIEMKWDGMCGEDYEWWSADFTPDEPALYWYHFEYRVPYSSGYITKRDYDSCGQLGWGGTDWQITVYDKDFKVPEWLKGGIIYQIFPDRFAVGSNGVINPYDDRVIRKDYSGEPYWRPVDGKVLNNDYFGGNLQGIEEHLPMLKNLGVTCIYLNPIFEAHANHRYNTADYLKIDGMLGTEEDLKHLCAEAKKYKISIILDGVFSHVGQDSRYFNMYERYDEIGAYNSKDSKYYPWFKFNNWPDDYRAWWGIKLLPEIIEDNEDFLEFITGENGVARKWLKAGIKGWRLDVADELPDIFLEKLRAAVKAEDEDALIIGEVWEDATNKISYDQRRKYLLGNQLDSVMNYPFANAIINFIRNGGKDEFIEKILCIIENYPPDVLNSLMNMLGTHDTPRIITRLAGEDDTGKGREWQSGRTLSSEAWEAGIKKLKLATLIQFTLPGVPSIYYGDEAGTEGYSDPFNRFFYPWGREKFEIFSWYKRIGNLRRVCPALKEGDIKFITTSEDTLCYIREKGEDKIIIGVNRSDEQKVISLPEEWSNPFVLFGEKPNESKVLLNGNDFFVYALGDWF